MARKRFHNLKRPKIRQDWSKWTFYNLSRLRDPYLNFDTFFQQKWKAKSLTRGYHGNQIREKKWQIMFDRRIPAVVPMDASTLARTDGSEQSGGRGLGKHEAATDENVKLGEVKWEPHEPTPYMQNIYWPTERRLDTAVFRALFASSALQARQFVVHGWVKVNGKKMRHPGYLLNPGDMFQIDPERVMYATGARKFDKNNPEAIDSRGYGQGTTKTSDDDDEAALSSGEETASEENGEDAEENKEEAQDVEEEGDGLETQDSKKALQELLSLAKDILADPKQKAQMSGKRKQAMREYSQRVKSTISKIRGDSVDGKPAGETIEELQATLEFLQGKTTSTSEASSEDDADAKEATGTEEDNAKIYSHRDARLLRQALDFVNKNPSSKLPAESIPDPSKAYATPWKPRPYMSAFAFIPRYLEVDHKICSAVYIRHPVVRPGLAEVPSPFNETIYTLAHNWYLRRR